MWLASVTRHLRGWARGIADLVAWELVDASAITVVEATMFTIGRGFAVPKKREGSATEIVKDSSSLGYMPAHHDSMTAQKHESSSP